MHVAQPFQSNQLHTTVTAYMALLTISGDDVATLKDILY